MRKWVILIIVIAIGGAIFGTWLEQRKTRIIVNILDSIPEIDSISVRDNSTKDEIRTITKLDPSFSDMVEIFHDPYKDVTQSERKLLGEEPFVVVEYLTNHAVRFKVSIYQIYQLKDEQKSLLSNEKQPSVGRSYSYMYSPEDKNSTYVFAIDETNQLLGVNDGLKELLHIIHSTKVE